MNSFLSKFGGAFDALDEVDGGGLRPRRAAGARGCWRRRRACGGVKSSRLDRSVSGEVAWTRCRRVVDDLEHVLLDSS